MYPLQCHPDGLTRLCRAAESPYLPVHLPLYLSLRPLPGAAIMRSRCNRILLLAGAGSLLASSASAQGTVLISDDFEVNSSADYTIVNSGANDGTQDFGFDYIAAGLPLAPRSSAGDTTGLRLTANDTMGISDHWTLFHNTAINSQHYTLTVDVFMNYMQGAVPTTEFAHIGVGGDGATFNSVFTPISGSGAFLAFTGDGGSNSDYRWFRDGANTPAGGTGSTTLPNSHSSYLGNGSNASGPFFQALFPSPPASIAGSPANIWTTVEIDVDNVAGIISFSFDGTLTFQGNFGGTFNDHVSIGLADIFTSIAGTANVFMVCDNLEVKESALTLGTAYCPAVVNSSGNAAVITAAGSGVVANNNVTLTASDMPLNAFGFFLTSQTQGLVMNPGGSQGNLCLSGGVGRYVGAGQITGSGSTGEISLVLDLNAHPTPTGLSMVLAGETWNFQAWFRDAVGMLQTSNFTNGVEIPFL